MKSKITIDVDHDNQPVIKIEFSSSDDVRDKLVQKFLESFGSNSSYTKFHYLPYSNSDTRIGIIRPIFNNELKQESKIMTESYRVHEKMEEEMSNINFPKE